MKKEITLGQLLSASFGLIAIVATAWITISNKVAVAESDIRQLKMEREQDRIEYKGSLNELKFKLDDIQSGMTKILVTLENKKDRDK